MYRYRHVSLYCMEITAGCNVIEQAFGTRDVCTGFEFGITFTATLSRFTAPNFNWITFGKKENFGIRTNYA